MNTEKVDHYGATYEQFAARIYADVRREAFGEDIGQTGWLTADEHDLVLSWLKLKETSRLLDVACGSGGPSLRAQRLSGCRIVGIDVHRDAVRTAQEQAHASDVSDRAVFKHADAANRLPFDDASFDAVVCIDAINHLPDRAATFLEWARLLKPGGRLVFTDPVVITGPVSNTDLAVRSSIGAFLFLPPGVNEQLLAKAGFELQNVEDRTANMANMASSWREARQRHADALRAVEGDETFDGQQRFFAVAGNLAGKRRLSRFAYHACRAH